MADLPEVQEWTPAIYQLETTDPVEGGPEGVDNLQAKQLANRTKYLKALVDGLSESKQPLDATLTALAAMATAANQLIYATGSDAFATTALTAFARTLLDDANAATARATLGLGAAALLTTDVDVTLAANSDTRLATQKATKAYIDMMIATNDAMVFKGVLDCSTAPNYPAADRGHTYRVSVSGKIGGASGLNVEAGDILICTNDGIVSGTQVAVGTNWGIIQTNIDGALTTAHIGSSVQAFDATLAALAALATAADKLIYATGSDAFATTALTAFARTLLDDADAATARATLGLPESGLVHQLGRSVNTITATYTAIIPFDGTTPLISEGTTILSVTAAASRSTSRIRLQGSINAVQTISGLVWIVTVYKDSTLLNVYISPATSSGQTAPSNVTFFIDTLASDTNSHTYSVNIGVASYGVIINPSGLFSANTSSCYLSVDEVTL